MEPLLLVGAAGRALSTAVGHRLGLVPQQAHVERFPDGEADVSVPATVDGRHMVLFQSLAPEPDRRSLELALLVDALRRQGARTCTVVAPYLAYARQDHRGEGEPLGAQVILRALDAAAPDALISVDLHARALESALRIPLRHLSAAPLLAEALVGSRPADPVIVAPDLGAAKLAQRYAELLRAPMAVVAKVRLAGDAVRSAQVLGEVAGRTPILVDDMISTGGTLAAASAALLEAGSRPVATVAATHGLFAGAARRKVDALQLQALLTTDSLDHGPEAPAATRVVSLAPIIAHELERLLLVHYR